MSEVELTQLEWAGHNLRRLGTRSFETAEIVARADTNHYSVLYLRSGEKVLVRETLAEIERMSMVSATQRDAIKRFKRQMRECKGSGMPVDQAFAVLWEELGTQLKLDEQEQASLYRTLLDWTKRWLK